MSLVGRTAQGAVHNGCGLHARYGGLRAEHSSLVALDESELGRSGDIALVPRAWSNIGENILSLHILQLEEADGYLGKLSAAYLGVGAERAVLIAAEDAQLAQGRDSGVEPVAHTHVAVTALIAPEALPRLIREQAEEDGRHLGTRYGGLWAHGAVPVAYDVAEVVLGVQPARSGLRLGGRCRRNVGRNIYLLPARVHGLVVVHGDGFDGGGQLLVLKPAGEGESWARRDLVQLHDRSLRMRLVSVLRTAV